MLLGELTVLVRKPGMGCDLQRESRKMERSGHEKVARYLCVLEESEAPSAHIWSQL